MDKFDKLKSIFDKAHESSIRPIGLTAYGYQYNYDTTIYKTISKFGFFENEIKEEMIELGVSKEQINRCGRLLDSLEYITIHDTASASPTADEFAHSTYVKNGGGGTSWHYSIGEKAICHHLPDNEVGYHAGDGTKVKFELTKSNVIATTLDPSVTIEDGYYSFNGIKSNIEVPKSDISLTTEHINDAGIRVDITDDGYYSIGITYYNPSYKKIANRGGNNNSIGIETMVNKESDLMKTWHRCAKYVAKLLVDNNLEPSRVKPHHFFSGKNCPMTLRKNNLWAYFLECVQIEYEVLLAKEDVEIIFKHYNESIDEYGFIKNTTNDREINYQIILRDKTKAVVLSYKTLIYEK